MDEIKIGSIVFYKWGGKDPREGRPSLVVGLSNGFVRLVYGTKQATDMKYLRRTDAVIPASRAQEFGLDCETRFDFLTFISRPVGSVQHGPVGNITDDNDIYRQFMRSSAAARKVLRRRMETDVDGD